MRRYAILAVIVLAAGASILALHASLGGGPPDGTDAFHVTLASPGQYNSGVYSETFDAAAGEYTLRFVPNGDSPRELSVLLRGQSVSFSETYILRGTLHDTGISEYYTWEYSGNARVVIPSGQQVTITIDPHGNTAGPVSVMLE